jgi:exodeoxyribonuclease VII small subunit
MVDQIMSFENRLKKLESLVKDLDSDIPLDGAISKYEEGMSLAKACQKDLELAEKKILKIVEKDGAATAVPIEKHEFPTLF